MDKFPPRCWIAWSPNGPNGSLRPYPGKRAPNKDSNPNWQPCEYVSLPEVTALIQEQRMEAAREAEYAAREYASEKFDEWQTSTKLYRVSAWVERSDYYLAGHARATAQHEAELDRMAYLLEEWEKDHAIANARNDSLHERLIAAEDLLKRMQAIIGNPDAAEGCRIVLRMSQDYFAKHQSPARGEGEGNV